jgi:replicative DNA helicase
MGFYNEHDYAEQAVLGSLLTDNNTWDEIGDYLQVDDFSSQWHRDIYRAIQCLLLDRKKADVICVSQCLINEKIVHLDPFVELCKIMRSQFVSNNIKYYAEIVKQKNIDRKMILAAQNIISSVREQKENRLDHAQQNLAEISKDLPCGTVLVADVLKSVLNSIDERNNSSSTITGLGTGYVELDAITNGLQCGDLIILAGRPGMGKTLLAMNIAEHVSLKEKGSTLVFSLEMNKEKLIERFRIYRAEIK